VCLYVCTVTIDHKATKAVGTRSREMDRRESEVEHMRSRMECVLGLWVNKKREKDECMSEIVVFICQCFCLDIVERYAVSCVVTDVSVFDLAINSLVTLIVFLSSECEDTSFVLVTGGLDSQLYRCTRTL